MAKNILWCTDYYYPQPTSIGVCSDAVIRMLLSLGYNVDVLCFGETNSLQPIKIENGSKVYFVKDRLWERLSRRKNRWFKKLGILLCRISQVIFMHWFPMQSTVHLRFTKQALKLCKKIHYDIVVSTYAPFEATWAGAEIKKKYKDVQWKLYILDTFTNRGKSKYFSEVWNDKHGWKWERKFFSKADNILILKCHQKHHQQERYNPFWKKIFFIDIPLFDPHKYDRVKMQLPSSGKHFIYTGRIDSHWYSPVDICTLFMHISLGKDWTLHFFGNPSDCEEYLDEMNLKTNGRIIKEGFVSRKRVEYELKNADILISFCHMDSEMIQSKIFDYMSTGNKIIHLTNYTFRDSARAYYEHYPNVYVLDVHDIDNPEKIRQIIEFVESDKQADCENISKSFIDNTANATAEIIANYI